MDYQADNAAAVGEAVTEQPAAGAAEDGAAAVENDTAAGQETPAGQTDPRAETRAFSQRLNRMSAKAVDDFVSQLGWTDPATGQRITTRAEFEACRPRLAADTQAPLRALTEELERYRVREQDAALAADPDLGEAYQAMRGEVLGLVDYCRRQGRRGIGVSDAFQALLQKNAGKIFRDVRERASAQAIAQTQAAAKASPGKLGGGDIPGAEGFSGMSDEEFERQIAAAKRGALTAR